MKINTRITVIILEIGLIPLLLVAFIGYSNTKEQITENTFAKLDSIAQIQKNRLEDVLGQKRNLNSLLTKSLLHSYALTSGTQMSSSFEASVNDDLAKIEASTNDIQSIFVTNSAGIVIAATDRTLFGKDVSGEDFFKEGIKQTDVCFLKKDAAGNLCNYLVSPMVVDGKTMGVMVIVTGTKDIASLVNDRTGLGETGETMLVKDDGKGNALFITPSRFGPDTPMNLVVLKEKTNVPAVHAIIGEEGVFRDAVDYRNIQVFAATRYIPEAGWGIVVKIDQSEALAPIKKMEKLFLLLIFFVGFFIVLTGVLISRSITGPISELTAAADTIARGDLSQRIRVTSQDEIGVLGRAFNAMASKLEESYEGLEQKVRDRTEELERDNKFMVGRELKMIELKKEIARLKEVTGKNNGDQGDR